jgi:hypothetical protein
MSPAGRWSRDGTVEGRSCVGFPRSWQRSESPIARSATQDTCAS